MICMCKQDIIYKNVHSGFRKQKSRNNPNAITEEKTVTLVYLYDGLLHSNETTAVCINMGDFAKQSHKGIYVTSNLLNRI